MAVSPNTVLGKYRILREIARGANIVYEAIDPKMNRRVAIKELQLPPHLAGPQKRERVERFYREAKAAGTLTHPNIVTIHEIGQENDRHFLIMEYLDGQSLRDILLLQGALPLKETVEIALQMCDALSHAHARSVIHRDVKPENIYIVPGGIIKLTDFGIARITTEPNITSRGQVFGTPSYMSPEQITEQGVDHRTDLFSVGITLYEMLTGRKPFVGSSIITIAFNIMNSQPPMPMGIPVALLNILQKSLAKNPDMRYQSAAAMSADLRAEKFALASPQKRSEYKESNDNNKEKQSTALPLSTPKSPDKRHLTIFLCHGSEDKPRVRQLYGRLHADGFQPWLDELDLLPGHNWEQEISRAVKSSDVVLVCLSANSISRAGYVHKEIKYALDVADEKPEGAIFLIPLKLEECEVPIRLRTWQWVEYYNMRGYEILTRSLKMHAKECGLSLEDND